MKCSLGISNFLEEISVFPNLLFSSVSLHWSLRKVFLSLLAILWNSAFKWVYLSFSPLLFAFFLFTAICKVSSDKRFAFLHFFSLGTVLFPVYCTMSWTSVHSLSDTLSIRYSPLNLFLTSTVVSLEISFWSYLNGLVVFPTFLNLSLNLAIRSSWSEPESVPSLVFFWLYISSPSLAAKNIINLILVLKIWWCPCVESSFVLLEEGVCYDQCVPLAELY